MRLTSIKLVGFKSFVDPVTVPFESNMTAIVGPNGCGKSNVIDAVRWVMGESSAKMLRGESMADIIFNGSTGRKPVGQASIELVFDNKDGSLGGLYAQYAEIAVKRVVTREGQSTYFFNGEKCRRRDIADLFLGTGLGPRSYAIIGQGMISRLVEARPEELRATLEEAAGISKYKERRRETENRMRRTQDNLERLDDLREELDKQLERLKRQADAAKRYQTLKSQEHRLKGELALLRSQAWRARQQDSESQVRTLENERERNIYGVRECERKLEEFRLSYDGLAETLDQHQSRFSETTAVIARLEQQLEYAATRERQLVSDIEAAQRERAEFDQLEQTDTTRQHEIDERLECLALEREEAAERLTALETEQAELHTQQQQIQQQWDSFQQHNSTHARAAERTQSEVRRLESQRDDLDRQLGKRRRQLQELPNMEALNEERDTLEMQREEDAELRETLEVQRSEQREQRDAAYEEQQRLRKARESLIEQQHALKGEKASLQALLDAALNDEDSARAQQLAACGLEKAPLLAERLHVAHGWESIASWVLAPWLEARIADPTQLHALQLERGELGVISSQAPTARPDTLAALIDGAGALIEWLNGIHTADTEHAAWERQPSLSAGESIVTASGLWVGAGWSRRLGAQAREDSVIAQRRRLDEIATQLEASHTELAQWDDALEHAHLTQSECDEALERLHAQAAQCAEQHQRHEVALANIGSRLEHLAGRFEELEEEIAQLTERREENALEIEAARASWQAALTHVEDNAQERERLTSQRAELQHRLDQLHQSIMPVREQQSHLALEQQRLTTEREGMLKTRERGADQRERLVERIAQLVEERENTVEPQEMLRAQLDEYLDQRTHEEQTLTEVRERSRSLGEQMRECEQQRQTHECDLDTLRTRIEEMRLQVQEQALKADAQDEQLVEMGHDVELLKADMASDASESAWQSALEDTGDKIKRLGAINLAAIEEYDQQAERRNYLEAQHGELTEALDTLARAIRKIDQETRIRFKATFEQVNAKLGELFPKVFGGGAAWLTLTGEDLLETGVAIMARPPGKKNSTIHLLSGGEKTMTALSLVFAIFQLNPAPFCMLDEVDAPLDDANVGRYARLVRDMAESVQFIYITHNKIAMEAADRLMGVTMQEPGVSRLVAVDVAAAAALADA